jgi:hypothetical protein
VGETNHSIHERAVEHQKDASLPVRDFLDIFLQLDSWVDMSAGLRDTAMRKN